MTKTIVVQMDATPISGMRTEGIVQEIIPECKKFSLTSDEVEHIGGEETAPSPLDYVTAGVAF